MAATSSARRAKSAERIDGAIIGRVGVAMAVTVGLPTMTPAND
jgi:hypothetical protein